MTIKEVEKIVETYCNAQISLEEEEKYDFVKVSVAKWIFENYDVDAVSGEELSEKVISDQVRYFIRAHEEKEGIVKSTDEWKALEEAYFIVTGAKPEEFIKPKKWEGLKPDVIMFYAADAFARKKIQSLSNNKAGKYFCDEVVMQVIEDTGILGKGKFYDKKTIYDKCNNEKEFCAYFRQSCINKYLTAVKVKARETARYSSYEESSVAGGYGNGKKTGLSLELNLLLRLVLTQVAQGPLKDYGNTSGVYRNLGGAFGKYVPFLEEDFIEKQGRYELKMASDKDVPEELVLQPKAKKGAKQASGTMYPIVANHNARSAALLFKEIMKWNVRTGNEAWDWSDDFYKRIVTYEKENGKKKYCDVISSVKTMENLANDMHKTAIKQSMAILDKKLAKAELDEISEELLVKQLDYLLNCN